MKKLARALSGRIKTLRETAGLSQQEVAERGDLSVSLVGKLEQGKKADPRASTLLALARALDVTPGKLLDDLFAPLPAAPEPPTAIEPEKSPEAPPETSHEGEAPDPLANGKKKKKDAKKKKKHI